GGAVPVPCVVLDDQHRADAALLAPHHRTEIGIENIAALYACIHKVHTPPEEVPGSLGPLSFSHAVPEFIPWFSSPKPVYEKRRGDVTRLPAAFSLSQPRSSSSRYVSRPSRR